MRNTIFENIKHIDELGNECWYARELMPLLEYNKWQNFNAVVEKAKIACQTSSYNVFDQFTDVSKLITGGKGNKQKVKDYKLSRYACYLIAQNSDPRKEVVALAQTYFAIQTRRQELYDERLENERRLELRNKVKIGNLGLNRTAINSGVKDLARFHNAGYKGLYNGETADDIFKRKKLKYRQDILDHMGSIELASNWFRIVQTEDKLKRDSVDNEYTAESIHYEMGRKVRNAIKDMGGTMPEELSTPNTSLKEIKK